MSPSKLTVNDSNVLSKIHDPEFAVSAQLLIDDSLPRDPNIPDPILYSSIVSIESAIINTMISLDREQIKFLRGDDVSAYHTRRTQQLSKWLVCILRLDQLIANHPNYASARNNRVQALRTVYGDGLLIKDYLVSTNLRTQALPDGYPAIDILSKGNDETMEAVARKVLGDLEMGITLLEPKTRFEAVSPTHARTLAQLYTQRGQLYRAAVKKLGMAGDETKAEFRIRSQAGEVRETLWKKEEFEESAGRDLEMGGWYGNEVAKKVAVMENPMARLCGQIVSEAMRKEFVGGECANKAGNDENSPVENIGRQN